MANRFAKLHLSSLQNNELLDFFHQIERLIVEIFGENGLGLSDMFLMKLKAFEQVLYNVDEASLVEIKEADDMADDVWKGFYCELLAGMYSLNEVRKNAAIEIYKTFGQISDPTDLPYHDEYTKIGELLAMLDKLPDDLISKAQVSNWLFDMHQSFDNFMATNASLINNTETFDAIKNAKVELVDEYRVMINHLEFISFDDERHLSFIDKLAALIKAEAERIGAIQLQDIEISVEV